MSANGLVRLLLEREVLRFGDFTLKSGRRSPYFFNVGAVSTGRAIAELADAYAAAIEAAELTPQVVFGPAYKGIPLAVATAEALARRGADVGWAFDRKERKDHGEGGRFVGAPLDGRVVLVDDVLTAGTAIRGAIELIGETDATLAGIVIAMDRQELNDQGTTAVAALRAELGVPVVSLLSLQDVIDYLDVSEGDDNYRADLQRRIRDYQAAFCTPAP